MGKVKVLGKWIIIDGEVDEVVLEYPRRALRVRIVDYGDLVDIVVEDAESGKVLLKRAF